MPILQEKSKIRELVGNLYQVKAGEFDQNKNHNNKVKVFSATTSTNLISMSEYRKLFERLKFSFWEAVKFINIHASPIPFGFPHVKNQRDRKLAKFVTAGYGELDKALDIRSIVRY